MNAPASVTAFFTVPGFTCAITGDNTPSITDVAQIIGEALGAAPPQDTLAHGSGVTVVDVQKLIQALSGPGCIY